MLYLPPGEPPGWQVGEPRTHSEQLCCAARIALSLRALKTDTNLYQVLRDYSGEQSWGDPLSTLRRTIYPNAARVSRVHLLGDWTALVNLPGMRFVGDVSATWLRGAVSAAFVNGRYGCGGIHANSITLGTRHSNMSTVQGVIGCPDIHFITITFPTTKHLNEMVGDCLFGCWSRCADTQWMSGIKAGV